MRALTIFVVLAGVIGAGCARPAATSAATTFEQLAKESLAPIDGRVGVRGLKADVEVLRDEWGVPHIYARNVDDLFFAQGYVVGAGSPVADGDVAAHGARAASPSWSGRPACRTIGCIAC